MDKPKQSDRIRAELVQRAAEDATGCRQNPATPAGGPFWISTDSGGLKVSDQEARTLFRQGIVIHAPNAGAGSYNAVLERLGFSDVKVEDWTSSAGDWSFTVRSGFVCQSNRYPHCGFSYQYERKASLRSQGV